MRACVQRVHHARVTVAGELVGEIGTGMLVLLGVSQDDTDADARQLATKIASLRIFEDAEGKMNLALSDVARHSAAVPSQSVTGPSVKEGAMLVVSQFTLLGDCRKGRRPSFTDAAPPATAERLYQVFVDAVASLGIPMATGRFRQHMEVELVNDGPVTLLLDTAEWQTKS